MPLGYCIAKTTRAATSKMNAFLKLRLLVVFSAELLPVGNSDT